MQDFIWNDKLKESKNLIKEIMKEIRIKSSFNKKPTFNKINGFAIYFQKNNK